MLILAADTFQSSSNALTHICNALLELSKVSAANMSIRMLYYI